MAGGGKGGGGGSAHDYFGTIAGLVCAGPVDELVAIIADGKTVWPDATGDWKAGVAYTSGQRVRHLGRVWSATTGHTSSTGNAPTVGGQWIEFVLKRSQVANPTVLTVVGYGVAVFYWGTSTQTLSADVPELVGVHPPYRRQCFVVLKDWLFGRERTSAPNVEVVVRRAPVQSTVTGLASTLDADGQANPIASLAETYTDPVFGLGRPATDLAAPTWQQTADALTAEAARSHLSSVFKGDTFRSVVGNLLPYFDGWLRWDAEGKIEAGRFPRSVAPPSIPESHKITVHDLVEEPSIEAKGWPETASGTVVKFTNRNRAFKDAVVRVVNQLNVSVTGGGQEEAIERPFITRASQAAVYAAEVAKVVGDPALKGTLEVRRERTDAIRPGDLFRLILDTIGLDVICRCESRENSAPPSMRSTIRFEMERGLSAAPIAAAPSSAGSAATPPPETVSLFQIVQTPPLLADSSSDRISVLAARTSRVSIGLRVFLQQDDPSLFYDLGTQEAWAVTGTLAQSYSNTLPALGTEPQDDNSETLRVTLDPLTAPADLAVIGETQTADAINDGNLLVWIFNAGNPKQFEVCTLREIRVAGAESFYRLKVRRSRFGTSRRSFSTGDRVFILPRANLATYGHSRFATYALNSTTATFRFASFNAWGSADLADPVLCPNRTYQFADAFAPTVSFSAIQYRPNSGAAWTDVTNFAADYNPAGQWRIVAALADSNGDMASASLQSTSGILTTTIAVFAVGGSAQDVENVFALQEGDWTLLLRVTDATGRQVEQQLVPVGGGSPVTIRSRAAGSTVVANPVASPRGGFFASGPTVTLTSSTAGATIDYQIVTLGAAAGTTWNTYSSPVNLLVGQTLYARARFTGWTTSSVVRNDYRFRDPDAGNF
jgi:hypothetical protein